MISASLMLISVDLLLFHLPDLRASHESANAALLSNNFTQDSGDIPIADSSSESEEEPRILNLLILLVSFICSDCNSN